MGGHFYVNQHGDKERQLQLFYCSSVLPAAVQLSIMHQDTERLHPLKTAQLCDRFVFVKCCLNLSMSVTDMVMTDVVMTDVVMTDVSMTDAQATSYLNKLPKVFSPEDRVLVADPMLATGILTA